MQDIIARMKDPIDSADSKSRASSLQSSSHQSEIEIEDMEFKKAMEQN